MPNDWKLWNVKKAELKNEAWLQGTTNESAADFITTCLTTNMADTSEAYLNWTSFFFSLKEKLLDPPSVFLP